MSIGVTLAVIALAEGVLHWFPWRAAIGKPLPRIPAYTLGVLAILVPLMAHDITTGHPDHAIIMLAAAVTAGASVLAAYAIDWAIETHWRAQSAEAIAGQLAKQLRSAWESEDAAS